MTIVVTGASSFIGSHLCSFLSGHGRDVIGTYRNANHHVDALRKCERLDLVELDIADDAAFSRLPARVHAVVHAAGLSVVAEGTIDAVLACNVVGTRNVVKYAVAAQSANLVYLSSISVHGDVDDTVLDRRTPVRSPSVYGATKLVGERLVEASSDVVPAVALRLPGVLGPGAHRAWIPTLVNTITAGREIVLYNSDGRFNNAAHVRDIAALTARLVEARFTGFDAFPLGALGSITVREVADVLMAVLGRSVPVRVQTQPRRGFVISSDHAIERFGYAPMEIAEMVRDYASAP